MKPKLPPYDPNRNYVNNNRSSKGSWQWNMQWVEKIERDNAKTGNDLLMVVILHAQDLRWLLENRPDFFEDEHVRSTGNNLTRVRP